jgi:hypothetical protein
MNDVNSSLVTYSKELARRLTLHTSTIRAPKTEMSGTRRFRQCYCEQSGRRKFPHSIVGVLIHCLACALIHVALHFHSAINVCRAVCSSGSNEWFLRMPA